MRAAQQQLANAGNLNDTQLAALKSTITNLQNSITSTTASLNQLNTTKQTANTLLTNSYPAPIVVKQPTANYYGGPAGATGPPGASTTPTVDSVISQGSSHLASSDAVNSAIVAGTQSTSVTTGTSVGGDSSVLLLCHFNTTGSSINVVDSSYYHYPQYNISTVSPATLVSSPTKFGNASLKCDAAGAYASIASTISLGSQSFTWETWANFISLPATNQYLYMLTSTAAGFAVSVNTSGANLHVDLVNTSFNWSYTFTTGQWYHIAIVVNNTALTVAPYINGTLLSSTSVGATSKTITDGTSTIGNSGSDTSLVAHAYLDEMCLRTGAVYTSSFTPLNVPYADAYPSPSFSSNPQTGSTWSDGRDIYVFLQSVWNRVPTVPLQIVVTGNYNKNSLNGKSIVTSGYTVYKCIVVRLGYCVLCFHHTID